MIAIVPVISFAQRGKDSSANGAKIQAQRVAYLVIRLDLSFQESVFFKEKYFEYEDSRMAIRRGFGALDKYPTNDIEANQLILARFQMEEDIFTAKKSFYEQLKTQISSLKLMLLPVAEKEFKEMLVQRLRQKRKQGGRGK